MVQRVSGVTVLLWAGPDEPGQPGTGSGGPAACDAAWHDFQHGTELNIYLTGDERGRGHETKGEAS